MGIYSDTGKENGNYHLGLSFKVDPPSNKKSQMSENLPTEGLGFRAFLATILV